MQFIRWKVTCINCRASRCVDTYIVWIVLLIMIMAMIKCWIKIENVLIANWYYNLPISVDKRRRRKIIAILQLLYLKRLKKCVSSRLKKWEIYTGACGAALGRVENDSGVDLTQVCRTVVRNIGVTVTYAGGCPHQWALS